MGQTREKQPSKRRIRLKERSGNTLGTTTNEINALNLGELESSMGSSPFSSNDGSTVLSNASAETSKSDLRSTSSKQSAKSHVLEPQIYDPRFVEVRTIEGKGKALVATRRISPGTLVLAEVPVIRLTADQERDDAKDLSRVNSILDREFQALNSKCQNQYRMLHDCKKEKFTRTRSIYYSNCYNLTQPRSKQGGSCVGFLASRINHSCIPNVQLSFSEDVPPGVFPTTNGGSDDDERSDDFIQGKRQEAFSLAADAASSPAVTKLGVMLFYAIRTIKKNEEILSNYNNVYNTTAERHNEQHMYYNFMCSCAACEGIRSGHHFWAGSDGRRQQMKMLRDKIVAADKVWPAVQAAYQLVRRQQSTAVEDGLVPGEHVPDDWETAHKYNGVKEDTGKPNTSHDSSMWLRPADIARDTIADFRDLEGLLLKERLHGIELVTVYAGLAHWSGRLGDLEKQKEWLQKEQETCTIAFGMHCKRVKELDEMFNEVGLTSS